jgi:hypothetical protein
MGDRSPDPANLPIVMLSSVSYPGDNEADRQSRIFARLMKPAQPSELLNAILNAIETPAALASAANDGAPERQGNRMPQMRVLLAEDNAVNRQRETTLLAPPMAVLDWNASSDGENTRGSGIRAGTTPAGANPTDRELRHRSHRRL